MFPFSSYKNNERNQIAVNNKSFKKITENHNINLVFHIHNSFLQHTSSTNNLTEIVSSNNPHITINIPNERISLDEVPSEINSNKKTKSELSKYIIIINNL